MKKGLELEEQRNPWAGFDTNAVSAAILGTSLLSQGEGTGGALGSASLQSSLISELTPP